jgi:hypothetical protein
MPLTLPAPVTRRAGSLVLVGVAVTALAGCADGVPNRLDFSDTEKVKVTEIVIGSGSGDVTVSTSATAETRINRVVRYETTEPGRTYRLEGTVLHIDTDCGDNCTVSYDIAAPTGVAIRGELGSGDVALTDVATVALKVRSGDVAVTRATGAVKAETSSGDIVADDLRGATHLVATSGDIRARNMGGAALAADATSGDISLELSRPGAVTAHVNSGDVRVMVPQGSYQVHTSASSGDVTVTVPDDPAGKNLLDVRTNSGDVTVGVI